MLVYLCLAVYNEEKNLMNCISSINRAIKKIRPQVKTIICLNGCTDSSLRIAKECKQDYPFLNIRITKSVKGKLNAQKKMLSLIPKNKRTFFIDSDTEISEDSISIMLKELDKHKGLIAVGGFPIAKKYEGFNPWKKLLDNILNIRSRHPMCEISKLEVLNYHKLANLYPQRINTNKEHESKSKIFFHGRLFLLKSKKYWNMPPKSKKVVGDDSYLPDYIIYNYGKNRIRIRYDALVYFKPLISIKEHYRAYKRIYYDLKNLKDSSPEFSDIREHSVLILDKDYIIRQKVLERVKFAIFNCIRCIEKMLYKISFERDPKKIWEYNT